MMPVTIRTTVFCIAAVIIPGLMLAATGCKDSGTTSGESADGDIDASGEIPEQETETDDAEAPPLCKGCRIDETCVEPGDAAPGLGCAVCDPERNAAGWSPRTAGVTCRETAGECDAAEYCSGDALGCPADGFAVAGTSCGSDDQCDGAGTCADCIDSGGCDDFTPDANPCTSVGCENLHCTDIDDNGNACDLGYACTDDICADGVCMIGTVTAGCLIDDLCIAEGASGDADGCVACDPALNTRGWSDIEGAACAVTDDGNPCTDDLCHGGRCVAVDNDDNTCTDAWGCTDTVCSGGDCVVSGTNAGCYIDETCLNENDRRAPAGNDSCLACVSAVRWDAWTPLATGVCDDGDACTRADTCTQGGVCSGTRYSCNGHGACNSHDDVCDCDEGYAGDYCDTCAEGYLLYPDCRSSFVTVVAGSFWMGSPAGCPGPEGYPGECTEELGRDGDETLHEVTLTHDFEIGRYELTEGEFTDMMNWNPRDTYDAGCSFGCGDDHPVKTISWFDALAYANRLSVHRGLTPCYELSDVVCEEGGGVDTAYMDCFDGDATGGGIDSATVTLTGDAAKPQECQGYRLPTEAEWEYAIRAGNQYTAFYQSEGNDGTISGISDDPNMDAIGWYAYNNTVIYHSNPVGGKAPNAFGLYDMSGNVWELVWDWYQAAYENDTPTDPAGPSTSTGRVSRGGGTIDAMYCRSASRTSLETVFRSYYMGTRICRSLP